MARLFEELGGDQDKAARVISHGELAAFLEMTQFNRAFPKGSRVEYRDAMGQLKSATVVGPAVLARR